MARTVARKTKSKKPVKSKDKKKKLRVVKCTRKLNDGKTCNKKYSKISNLNTHIRKDHELLRWICPDCKETQVSKDSHVRHCLSQHSKDVHESALENQFTLQGTMQMTEAAKDANIKSLVKTLEERNQMCVALHNELLNTKKLLAKYQAANPSFVPDEESTEKDEANTNEGETSKQNSDSETSYDGDEEDEGEEEMDSSEHIIDRNPQFTNKNETLEVKSEDETSYEAEMELEIKEASKLEQKQPLDLSVSSSSERND